MAGKRSDSGSTHMVIVNDRHQFAVWPGQRPIPPGWRPAGRTGSRTELAAYLKAMGAPMLARARVSDPGPPSQSPPL